MFVLFLSEMNPFRNILTDLSFIVPTSNCMVWPLIHVVNLLPSPEG